MDQVGATIERLANDAGVSLAELSRVLGRNAAYLQQFVRRGSPRVLADRDRRLLARYLGVDEALLGGEPAGDVAVPYLQVEAAAGTGAAIGREGVIRHELFARAMLRAAGIAPAAASIIDVRGDSMAPGIRDGDRLLVDRDDSAVRAAAGVFVLRRVGELLVKRLSPVRGGLSVASDNPDHARFVCGVQEIVVIGRAKLLLRVPE